MGKGVSMPRKSKILQKIYRGLIGGACASLVVLVFGPLWHSFLGHSHGFGFYSFNVLGWILLYCFGAIVGSIKGIIIGLVDLLEKSWLTLICSLILWGARPSIELFHTIKRTKKVLYLDGGYAVLSILAAILCVLIVVKGKGVVSFIRRERSKTS
jgi:hypothetical protein